MLGWHNDVVDRKRDAANESRRKPVGQGLLDPGHRLVRDHLRRARSSYPSPSPTGSRPEALTWCRSRSGWWATSSFRRSWLSWLPWAASYALYPAFLSYGGWGGAAMGDPPEISITVLAGALGICVHFLRALPGLVADNRDGYRNLPLRVALKIGAPWLLWLSIAATILVVAGLLVTGNRVGLDQ